MHERKTGNKVIIIKEGLKVLYRRGYNATGVKEITDKQTPPIERIESLYQMKIEHFISKGRYSFGCFLCNITLRMADLNEMIASEAIKAFGQEYQPIID